MLDFFAHLYGRSTKWKTVRKQHLEQHPECAACGREKDLEVHHIVPYHVNPDLELELSNLITLCSKCHFIFGHLMDWKSWNTNVTEDSAIYRHKKENRPYSETFASRPRSSCYEIFCSIFNYIVRLFY